MKIFIFLLRKIVESSKLATHKKSNPELQPVYHWDQPDEPKTFEKSMRPPPSALIQVKQATNIGKNKEKVACLYLRGCAVMKLIQFRNLKKKSSQTVLAGGF